MDSPRDNGVPRDHHKGSDKDTENFDYAGNTPPLAKQLG